MKIVLTTGPRALGEIEMAGLPFLGIGYVASYLEKNSNHNVIIVDAHSENLSIEQAVVKILSFNPDTVGLTATTHNRLQVIAVIKLLRKSKPSLFIMVGGPHFSLTSVNALEVVPEIDCVINGEGELTSKELLDVWPDQDKLKNVLGITYRGRDSEIISNKNRPFFQDLSKLPFPSWHLYNLDKYQKKIYGTNFRTIGVISARGCPNFCTYCCNAAFSKSILRLRHPKNFVDELEFLNKEYGFNGFNIWDDTLTISRNHVMEICQEIINRNLNIKWYARARVNTVDKEIIEMMKRAGCLRISFGIESGSPRILNVVKKNILLDQARRMVYLCSRAGLIVSLNFIVNLPTQTMFDLRMTADLINEFRQIPNVSVSYGFGLIYPGTIMESYAKENTILSRDFSWNSDCNFGKSKITGEDPSVPYMEWPGMELEKVKAFMVKNLMSKEDILKRSWYKLKRIKSWSDIKNLLKIGFNYFNI
ncbi:B12-binding domain-containing radical SAM protein [Patescibacteria group bacterium]